VAGGDTDCHQTSATVMAVLILQHVSLSTDIYQFNPLLSSEQMCQAADNNSYDKSPHPTSSTMTGHT
jgi:hypothetical protein